MYIVVVQHNIIDEHNAVSAKQVFAYVFQCVFVFILVELLTSLEVTPKEIQQEKKRIFYANILKVINQRDFEKYLSV